MKKIRNALFATICLVGLLTACGESPTAPSADVPLAGAAQFNGSGWNADSKDSKQSSDSTNTVKPTNRLNSGYILGM